MAKYDFLKDPKAVGEINRYKWIESEKVGFDIGFDEAAKQWTEKHGCDYLKSCCKPAEKTIKKAAASCGSSKTRKKK
jgi:hypothetical protein